MTQNEFPQHNLNDIAPDHEADPSQLDVLIVLGKNIGIGSSPEDIRSKRSHLSMESEMNALAAGMLYYQGMKIVFSTGHTAGENAPSEAAAMRDYMLRHFDDIQPEDVILEENSIDTASNAAEVAKILDDRGFSRVGLLTVGYHLPRSAEVFQRAGINVEQSFTSDELLRQRSDHYEQFIARWDHAPRIQLERVKEAVGRLLLRFDEDSKILGAITSKTRK